MAGNTQTQRISSNDVQNTDMNLILSPLDSVMQIALDLSAASHAARRNSLQDGTFSNIITHINEAKNNIINYLFKNNQALTAIGEPINQSKTHISSYASIVKKKNPPNNLIINAGLSKPDHSTILETEQKIVSVLKKTQSHATMLTTNASDSGNIVVKFNTNDDLKALKPEIEKELGNKVKVNSFVLPKIKIVGVPQFFETKNKKDAENSIIADNPPLKQLLETGSETFELLFDFKSKNGKSLVFKCSPKVRALLYSLGDTIKVEYKQCRLYDRIHLSHCTKCAQYGHTRKLCTSTSTHCTYCACTHDSVDCPYKDKKELHKCYNCFISRNDDIKNNASTHNAFSENCPIFAHLKNKLIERTDFGFLRQEKI